MPARKKPRKPTRASARTKPADTDRLGVWLIGAHGGLATTLIVGSKAIASGLCGTSGLYTETPPCAGLGLQKLDGLVFGGHDIRRSTVLDSAREILQQTGTLPERVIERLASALEAIDEDIKLGTAMNCGATILGLRGSPVPGDTRTLRQVIAAIQGDIARFQRRHRLRRTIVVNVASTEPLLRLGREHRSLSRLDACLDADRHERVRASLLYAYAAADLGLPFIHFTASNAGLVPAVEELFTLRGAPYMGFDGKTGETLVKSALSPMFKYRHLRVLSWQGYNMLGDRDGVVLADRANKQAKVETKDALLQSILGYPLHTHVGIDFVPSLGDLKTAWDFIHFQGFLDHRMSMQFTWQGCDSILAAPIVLDMIRFADLARRRGESGRMHHLACYFKHPLGVEQHDLHQQWGLMLDYLQRVRDAR